MVGNVKESLVKKEGKKLVRQGEKEEDQKFIFGGLGDKILEYLLVGDLILKQVRVKSFFKNLMYCNGYYLLGFLNLEEKKAFSTSIFFCIYL